MQSTTDMTVDPELGEDPGRIFLVEVQAESKVIFFEGAALDTEVAPAEAGAGSVGGLLLEEDRRIEAKGPYDFEMRNIPRANDGDPATLRNGDESEIGTLFGDGLLRCIQGMGAEGVKEVLVKEVLVKEVLVKRNLVERILVERISCLLPESPLRKEKKQ